MTKHTTFLARSANTTGSLPPQREALPGFCRAHLSPNLALPPPPCFVSHPIINYLEGLIRRTSVYLTCAGGPPWRRACWGAGNPPPGPICASSSSRSSSTGRIPSVSSSFAMICRGRVASKSSRVNRLLRCWILRLIDAGGRASGLVRKGGVLGLIQPGTRAKTR